MTAGAAPFPPEIIPVDQSVTSPLVPALRRTYWQQVAHDVWRDGGARIGLGWIALLVFAAVFAPLLANTQPILLKSDNRWSSPLLNNLTPWDVTLLVLALVSISAMLMRRIDGRIRTAVAGGVAVATLTLALLFLHPPETVDWQHVRDLRRAGHVQRAIMTPLPFSPNDYQRDDADARLKPPSAAHPLGTETDGADILSRMIYACRIALAIGLISTGISIVIGIALGGLMGYFAGTADILGMRLIEIFEAIPQLFLIIAFIAFFGRNIYLIMVIIGLTGWTDEARYIRAEFLRLRNQDFVQAAIAGGLPLRSILFRHLLPNGISPILVTSSFGIASAILYESTLSFLGLGVVDEPSWGQLLNQARSAGGTFTWWIALFPGVAIFLTVFSYNLIGEAIRDALDPRLLKRD